MEHTVLNGFVNLLGYFKTLTYVLSGHSFVFLPQACKCQRQPCVGEKRRREETETMNCIPDGFGMVSFKGLLLFVGFFFSFDSFEDRSLWVVHTGLELCGPDWLPNLRLARLPLRK